MESDVVFLDIDGVLNPDKIKGSADLAEDCVAELQSFLVAAPKTKIVLSTSWRLGFPLFALGWLWHRHELQLKAVIGRTPNIRNDMRGLEIRHWLQNSPMLHTGCNIRRFAILDDEIEHLQRVLPRKCIFGCDSHYGLTREIADRLIRHFSE